MICDMKKTRNCGIIHKREITHISRRDETW